MIRCRASADQADPLTPNSMDQLTDFAGWTVKRSARCRAYEKQSLPDGRGSDGSVDTTRLRIQAATVRERSPHTTRAPLLQRHKLC
jgi:hypothetical protein